MPSAAWTCFALIGLTASTGRAQAPHPTAQLELARAEGANTCLAGPQLVKSVQARLGRSVFVQSDAVLRLRVALEPAERGWVARLTLSDSLGVLGTRELSSKARHCSALDESLALVVALLVDTPPERDLSEPATTETASLTSTTKRSSVLAAPARPPTPLQIPADTFAPREPWSFDAGLSVSAAVGLVPGLGLGMEAGMGLRAPEGPWLRLVGDWWFAREARIDATRGARVSLRRAGLDVCGFELHAGAAHVSACVGQRAGLLSVEAFGFQQNTASHRLALSLSAGVDSMIPIGRYFGLVCAIRAELPLVRDRFTGQTATGDPSLVFQGAPLAVFARAGVQVRL